MLIDRLQATWQHKHAMCLRLVLFISRECGSNKSLSKAISASKLCLVRDIDEESLNG